MFQVQVGGAATACRRGYVSLSILEVHRDRGEGLCQCPINFMPQFTSLRRYEDSLLHTTTGPRYLWYGYHV